MLTIAFALLLATQPKPVLVVDVDARDIAQRIIHTKVVVPRVKAGPMTLHYPKWIPGEHGPSGPINGVVNLKISAAGRPLAWTRDPLEPYAFNIDVPTGSDVVDVTFDYVAAGGEGAFSATAPSSQNVAVLSFNHVVLAPAGLSDETPVRARLILPKGWGYGSGMQTQRKTGDIVDFEETTLTTLIDSPVNMGRHHKRIDLGDGHTISIAAESAAALDIPADTVAQWKQLVAEATAAFGSRPYRNYEFLLTLSDVIDVVGLEHHESSDNRIFERTYIEDDKRLVLAFLLPHELAHSWNGKFRRPAGLATGDYITPMRTELLWVYEGLTEYLGWVLAARSGLQIEEEWAAERGLFFADILQRGGRDWRPLQDTATAAHHVYNSPRQWGDLRRRADFYDESALLWLGADVKIRQLTNGGKSLDDFLKRFYGGPKGKPEVKTYTFDDVVVALNEVAPFDWKSYWRRALDDGRSSAAADALTASGWKIEYRTEATAMAKAYDGAFKRREHWFDLGVMLDADSGAIVDVVGGSAAWKGGVRPGMKLIAVNGRKDSPELMNDVLKRKEPFDVLVEHGEIYRTLKIDYRGGPRYPVLVREAKTPDILSQILAPKTQHVPRKKKAM